MNKKLNVVSLFTFLSLTFLFSCEKEDPGAGFKADFNFSYIDENHVKFTNESEGEYYSMEWDFGNGEESSTTDKKEEFQIYYPEAGEYKVVLTLYNYVGNSKSTEETVTINEDDLVLSFTAEKDPTSSNFYNLTNTSIGNFDSTKWFYRDKEIINESVLKAYFPFAGTYEIELVVFKNGESFSETESITISDDDPDFINKLVLKWSDEFDGNTINTNNWTFETGTTGWGNNELQTYTNGDNAEIIDGKLIITAKKVDENKTPGSYTSSRIISENKKEFKYGRMEIRAKLPSGTGIWPAIWTLGHDFRTVGWPACGEMDIMEYVGYEPNTVHSTVHTPSGYGGNGNGSSKILETCEEEFHVYGLLWTEKRLLFYTDNPDNITHIYNPVTKNSETWPFNKPHFFLLNIAVGGTWGGARGIDNSIFPQTMEIDFVRVYQEPDKF